jgi:hypothetical protein
VFIDGFSRDDFAAFVRAVPWRLAKTMAPSPHEYTPRKQARERGLESEFESAVRLIREEGYRQRYGSKVYTYYDVEDGEGTVWQYWTMGAPYERTILINRAKISLANAAYHVPARLCSPTTCREPQTNSGGSRAAILAR